LRSYLEAGKNGAWFRIGQFRVTVQGSRRNSAQRER
jgi:hypothetical protein